jgi:hypothetical protein
MIIFPARISKDDQDWIRACALLKVLPLDTRNRSKGKPPYYDCDLDYLVRKKSFKEGKWIEDPYYSFSLRFGVSASIHGSIHVDSSDELEEFKAVVNEALSSEICISERRKHELSEERRALWCSNKDVPDCLSQRIQAESRAAIKYYDRARLCLDESRRNLNRGFASLSSHEEVMELLLTKGAEIMTGNSCMSTINTF